jgi:hypothetical protein
MNPNDTGVVFEDDAMRHTINTSYYGDNSVPKSKFAAWMISKFPFIKNENSANVVMILFSVIILIISLSLFFGGGEKEISKAEQAKIDEQVRSMSIPKSE